ncbi:uncharacterized protein BJX67DRAFT_345140 [Aspergillus lucknowensis]|uniref:Uncharacterized protein n=1 Tax=Aspergillus lucknowensis TaxID=176173 RepID=A0ABR4M2V4_9EURO
MALSKEIQILLVIVGCLVSVLIGYSLHYVATNGFHGEGQPKEMTHEQRQYMRELRMKHYHWMARDARDFRGDGRYRYDVETPVESGPSSKET